MNLYELMSPEDQEALAALALKHPHAAEQTAELDAKAAAMNEFVAEAEAALNEGADDDLWASLEKTRKIHGPEACNCMLAMACPLHSCGCRQYRMPWECNCDR